MKKTYQVLIPIADNNGNRFLGSLIDNMETEMVMVFRGLTKGPQMEGKWVDDNGKLFADTNLSYYISIDNIQLIFDFLDRWNIHLKQESYFVQLISSEVHFYQPKKRKE